MRILEAIRTYLENLRAKRRASQTVAAEFRRLFPHETLRRTSLQADEPTRYVYWVWYGDTTPPFYQFFTVAKESGAVNLMEDSSGYAPEVWR